MRGLLKQRKPVVSARVVKMTEERIFENNGIKLVEKFGTYVFAEEICSLPVAITKKELINFVFKGLDTGDQAAMIISMIGIDEFWDKYSKPVPVKKWYVKVPHAHKTFYHKWFDCDVLGAQSVQGVYDQLNGLDNSCKFTNKEIKYYGLQDCEKVPVE